MKIGIISINIHTTTLNFGCIIHSFAFQQFLKKNGYDSKVIEYKPGYYKDFDVKHPLFSYVENEKPDRNQLIKWRDLFYEREIRYDKFFGFVKNHYITTDKCYTSALLDEEDAGFDCYICATDVIWKAVPGGPDKGYLLACDSMKGKKKIAYAASKGARKYNEGQEERFINAACDFDYIFVRENSLKDYMKETLDIDTPNVLDPVFLMDREFYRSVEIVPEVHPEKYVLVYLAQTMDDEFVQKVIEFADENQLMVIELSEEVSHRAYQAKYGHKFLYDIGVEEWLWYIDHAEWVFTNSFHGTCFSLIFQKQFFNGARGGDKIELLLEQFGLDDRWLGDKSFVGAQNMTPINYDAVNEVMEKRIAESSKCILDALKDVESREHRPIIADAQPYLEKSKQAWKKKQVSSAFETGARKIWKKIESPKLKKCLKKVFHVK
ncbi:polysaccharide pyruvyl transferase family protein [Butyrivibrio sp. AE3006]|uniref:polysaccharide pyruvyl transferase family protein n=1 Tax=Butyrivibrio sp. AE3006 TaxID=1280673 RepID=UPI000407986A|nr:polysaccharide pyruvyl transferase family protein [Butyrivibrio sp. AE3006]